MKKTMRVEDVKWIVEGRKKQFQREFDYAQRRADWSNLPAYHGMVTACIAILNDIDKEVRHD